jgi:hypothetical protein
VLDVRSAKSIQDRYSDIEDYKLFYRFHRVNAGNPNVIIDKYHPNSYLIHSKLYWEIGGYEEKLAGFYGKDGNFRRRLEYYGSCDGFLKDPVHLIRFETADIPDANTVEYGRKDSQYHVRKHPKLVAISRSLEKPSEWLKFDWEEICLK